MDLSSEALEYLTRRGYTPEMVKEEKLTQVAPGQFSYGGISGFVEVPSILFPVTTLSGRLLAWQTAGIGVRDYRTYYDPNHMYSAAMYGSQADFDILWDTGEVILTEGVFDRVAVKRAFPDRSVFARLTKGVSRQLVVLLNRVASKVWTSFDMDEPGVKASDKSKRALSKTRVVRLTMSVKDPGQLYEKKGVTGVKDELGRQIKLFDF